MQLKTSGIIIKRINYGEADRILTIFTRNQGKIKAIAKGSRKILSKLGGSLEPFCLVDFIFHEGKSFYIVTSASIIRRFENIHTDIDKTSKAFYIGEILDKSLQEHQKHPEIFDIFAKYLTGLEVVDDAIFIPIFSAKILEAIGFKPEVSKCLHCRNKLLPEQNFWDDVEGGVICQNCHDKFGYGGKISNDVIKILRLIFSTEFSVDSKININDKYKNQTEQVLESYIEGVLERELKSKKFMKDMAKS